MLNFFSRKTKEKIKIAILMVNGKDDYHDRLWLEISLSSIVKYISGLYTFKVFIWNHNMTGKNVTEYLQSFGNTIEVLDENTYDMSQYDKEGKYIDKVTWPVFSRGFNVHRTPLQILYQHATTAYDADIIFTFDTDSCPIRNNWDIPMVYALENGYKLTGIWRDELQVKIPPYVHPSFLGIKVRTLQDLDLRFDYLSVFPKEDTLSHFSRSVAEKYGTHSIYAIKRSNRFQYHNVFNGIYGGMFYHHHFGTRFKGGKHHRFTSFGWEERGEILSENKIIMDCTTNMLFQDPAGFINELAYGDQYKELKVYFNYLAANYSKVRCLRLWAIAKNAFPDKIILCFFLLALISREFYKQKKFSDFYSKVCDDIGLELEARAYRELTKQT